MSCKMVSGINKKAPMINRKTTIKVAPVTIINIPVSLGRLFP